jgi:hypothetical protein
MEVMLMRITKHGVLPVLAVLFATAAPAAEKTLSWYDESACTSTIRFDPAKYDEARMKDTVKLLYESDLDLPDPRSENADQVCKDLLETAGRLKFIPLKGIEDYQRVKIAELNDGCEFGSALVRGLKDPSALRDYRPAATACSRFTDALEGKSDITTIFRETVNRNCSKVPLIQKQCVSEALAGAQKADGKEQVRSYVVNFGWSECAASFMSGKVDRKKLDQMRADLDKQFRRTFKITAKNCSPN